MVHKDKIIKDIEFNYEGVFDFREFLHLLRAFFKRYDYDIDEKVYALSKKGGLNNTKIKWDCDRKLDDYNHAYIKPTINLRDYKESYVNGAKVVDGKLSVEVDAEVERDYSEQWKKHPTKKFVRAVYEKYVVSGKQKNVDNAVRNLVQNLIAEMKQYFKS